MPGFSLIAFAAASEPLRLANLAACAAMYRTHKVSMSGEPVTASNGTTVLMDGPAAAAPAAALTVVIGPNPLPPANDPALARWLRQRAKTGVPLAGVCTGSVLLARAGLLDGYRCTVHWEDMAALREAYPTLIVSDHLFEVDRDRLTASGGTAAMDMMLDWIGRDSGDRALVAATSELLVCERVRVAGDRQRIPLRQRIGPGKPRLSGAVALMEANVEEPLSMAELCALLDLSARQLERLFRDSLASTPTAYYQRLRLEAARKRLRTTAEPVSQVALATGFASVAHFSRRYKQVFGLAPAHDRQR